MDTGDNNQDQGTQGNNGGAGDEGQGKDTETITIPKKDYDTLNQTIGSLKRDVKDLKKPKTETSTETPQSNEKPADNGLLQKSFLRAAGLTHADDVALALELAKKWGVEVDALVDDEDFQAKLKRQQEKRSNEEATSNVRGNTGSSQAKNTPEYWKAKGTPPTPADVPDRRVRAKIIREMMKSAQGDGNPFYNGDQQRQ